MVSLFPCSAVNLRALRALLFEGEFSVRVDELGAKLLIVLANTSSVKMPPVSRGVLLEALYQEIIRIAKDTDKSKLEVKKNN
jgi:hypothetical protein